MMVTVKAGYLTEFPAGSIPCPSCGSTERPLVFRGWVYLFAFIFWAQERRGAGYLCKPCASTETTKALLVTLLLGWWSVPSIFFYGWRCTYLNWRSVWAPPPDPYECGAIAAAQFSAELREEREEAVADADEEWLRESTPLGALTTTQMEVVLNAEGLYELLQVSPSASLAELHDAYRQRCKETHPDLQRDTARASTELMIEVNVAWEILRVQTMRTAYDWLQEQRSAAAS